MKVQKIIALVLLLVLIVSVGISLNVNAEVNDCGYLLALLEKIVNTTLEDPVAGAKLARLAINISLPPSTADLHRKAYTVLLNYYYTVYGGVQDPRKLYELLQSLDLVASYANALKSCSRDPESFTAVVARVSRAVNMMRNVVESLINQLSFGSMFNLSIAKEVYNPGEEVEVKFLALNTSCRARSASLMLGDRILSFSPFKCNDGFCLARLRIPYAYQLANVGGNVLKLALATRVFCNSREISVYRFVTVRLRYPEVYVEAPQIIRHGDSVNLAIYGDSEYSASLYVGGRAGEKLVGVVKISREPRVIELNASLFSFGTNTIRLCVNATEVTLSRCFDILITVEPRYPRVDIGVSTTQVTMLGAASIAIANHEHVDVAISIYIGDRLAKTFTLGSNESRVVELPISIAPVAVEELKVVIQDIGGTLDSYMYRASVVVVNISSTLALTLTGLAMVSLIGERERKLLLFLGSTSAKGFRRAFKSTSSLVSIFKPYVLGLGSRVAEVYYNLIKRFTRLPLDAETLREHFRDAVAPVVKSSRAKELLWKLMLMVEKDLYSRHKQSVDEAKRLADEVLSEGQ